MSPRKNFYVNDADIPVYEKAKEYVGDSMSGFIMDALKKLVHEREDRGKDLTDIRLWVGHSDQAYDLSSGEYIKFSGRRLGSGKFDAIDDQITEYELYEARKGNFLLYITNYDEQAGTKTTRYEIFKDYLEVCRLNLPGKLLSEAEEKLKDFKCVELDI